MSNTVSHPECEPVPHIVRVSVSIPGLNIDLPLPANIPVNLVLSNLIPFLREILQEQKISTQWIDQIVRWKLTTAFGQRLSPSKTLQESGVLHGDLLMVEIEKTPEQFTPLIDDIADAIATIQARIFPDYSAEHSVTIISYTGIILSIIISLVIGSHAHSHRLGINHWFPLSFIVGGSICLLTAWIIEKRNAQSPPVKPYNPIIPRNLLLSGFLWIGTGNFIIIPRPLGAAHILATAILLLALAILSSRITLNHPIVHGAIIVPGVIFSLIGTQQLIFPQNLGTLGSEIVLLGMIFVFLSTKLSLFFARISLPPTPSPGEAHVKDTAIIAIGELIQSHDAQHDGMLPLIASHEEKKAIRQYLMSNALLFGAICTITIGAFFAVQLETPHFWYIISFLSVTAVILIFRGKSYSDLINRTILYIGSISTCCAAWVHLILQEPDPLYIISFTLTLLGIFCLFYIGIIQGRTLKEPISRQRIEIIERILYASVFPLITMISGLYSKARYHS